MQEIWKETAVNKDYVVSNLGNVKNKRTGRILTKFLNHKGYLTVWLSEKGKTKKYFVHRLVAMAFIPNLDKKTQVNHIDGNKTNNNINNLEWVTNQENILHSFRKLKRKHSGGAVKKAVMCIETNIKYPSIKDASLALGICAPQIVLACKEKTKTAGKYHWKYIKEERRGE